LGDPAGPLIPDMQIALRTNQAWKQAEEAEKKRRANGAGGRIAMIGGVGAVAAAVVAGVIFLTGNDTASTPSAGTPPATAGAGETRMGAHRTATITKDSNLRGGPSTSTAVVGSVRRGMQVAIIASESNWRHVRFARDGAGGVQEGWVHSSRLEEAPATPAPARERSRPRRR
jgi:uncharacterized protein YgiM (DUF1202 family)